MIRKVKMAHSTRCLLVSVVVLAVALAAAVAVLAWRLCQEPIEGPEAVMTTSSTASPPNTSASVDAEWAYAAFESWREDALDGQRAAVNSIIRLGHLPYPGGFVLGFSDLLARFRQHVPRVAGDGELQTLQDEYEAALVEALSALALWPLKATQR